MALSLYVGAIKNSLLAVTNSLGWQDAWIKKETRATNYTPKGHLKPKKGKFPIFFVHLLGICFCCFRHLPICPLQFHRNSIVWLTLFVSEYLEPNSCHSYKAIIHFQRVVVPHQWTLCPFDGKTYYMASITQITQILIQWFEVWWEWHPPASHRLITTQQRLL